MTDWPGIVRKYSPVVWSTAVRLAVGAGVAGAAASGSVLFGPFGRHELRRNRRKVSLSVSHVGVLLNRARSALRQYLGEATAARANDETKETES